MNYKAIIPLMLLVAFCFAYLFIDSNGKEVSNTGKNNALHHDGGLNQSGVLSNDIEINSNKRPIGKVATNETIINDKNDLLTHNVETISEIQETPELFEYEETLEKNHKSKDSESLTENKFQKEFMISFIEQLPRTELQSYLSEYSNFSDASLSKIEDLHAFSKKLYDIRYKNPRDEEKDEDADDNKNVIADLYFSTVGVDANNLPLSSHDSFLTSDKKVYASFHLEEYYEYYVIVRWLNPSGKLVCFDRYVIEPTIDHNYVSVGNTSWEPGEYYVDLFSANDPSIKLASGKYFMREP